MSMKKTDRRQILIEYMDDETFLVQARYGPRGWADNSLRRWTVPDWAALPEAVAAAGEHLLAFAPAEEAKQSTGRELMHQEADRETAEELMAGSLEEQT